MAVSFEDRLEGGLIGLLVGDALGVPYEFNLAHNLPPAEHLEMVPPTGWPFHRSHQGIPCGTWSDDGSQALCLLESLLTWDRLNIDDFAGRLVDWADNGHLAVDGRAYGLGNQTSRALRRLRDGVSAGISGPSDVRDNGNGSLMRSLPLALWHQGTDAELIRDACDQSRVTHGHARAQVCCALYVVWARATLHQRPDPWEVAVKCVVDILGGDPLFAEELGGVLGFSTPTGSGYVVDALFSARLAVHAGSYEVAVRRAISFGEDTDTTACIAGGIAGLRDGIAAVPLRWRDQLRGKSLVEPLWAGLRRRWDI